VIIAFILAAPVAIWGARLWLDNIAYHISLSWGVFAAGFVISLLIALVTVGFQGIKTANANPAKKLRNE
jgi:putative ABC transport system permease protein